MVITAPTTGPQTVGGVLETLAQRDLTRAESAATFARIVAGELAEVEVAALLAALKVRGASAGTIAGAADALRRAALPFPRPMYPFADTCGTGGDYAGTVNISTAAAFVAAALGVPVAKHGNRAVSSRCGSADVLAACGAALDAPPEASRRALDETGVCFLFAPLYHAGVRHAMPVRRALATRTVFNLLGPLINPARPTWQVLGVFDPAYCRPLAETLALLGCQGALVVHGDGMDELALHAPTTAALLANGRVTELEITPEEAGLPRRPLEELRGGGPEENAEWLKALLAGAASDAHRDAVALNAGALAWVAGKAASLADGAASAKRVLERGTARPLLDRFVRITRHA